MVNASIVDELRGESKDRFSIFEGSICDEDDLVADAHSKSNNELFQVVYAHRLILSFWKGSYADAEKWSELLSSQPSSKMPKSQLIYYTFFRGVIAFRMYRDGAGDQWLGEGKKLLGKLEVWLKHSTSLFESKVLLLKAEHCASITRNINEAISIYDASIKSARDHGFVHEQGLAYELKGKCLALTLDTNSSNCFKNAYQCYMQWGAVAKADQILKEHKLDLPLGQFEDSRVKHGREL